MKSTTGAKAPESEDDMSETTTTTGQETPVQKSPEDLINERDAQIQIRQTADSAGVKAAATRRIRELEAQMSEHGIDYEAFQVVVPVEAQTPEQLLESHRAAVELRGSASTAGVKAAATNRIKKLEAQMTEAGVEFTPYAPVTPAVEAVTDEQLVENYQQAKATHEGALTAGVKAAATRRVRLIEAEATKRGVDLEAKPKRGRKANA